MAAVMLHEMVKGMDTAALERLGPGLMLAMVETSDDMLNLTGMLIGKAMQDFAVSMAPTDYRRMMDGFAAYVETCAKLLG